jgi:superfamily II DNA helicase RecQ
MREFTKQELCKVLKYSCGHDEFRPMQLDAVQATLSGRDSLLILPTGASELYS